LRKVFETNNFICKLLAYSNTDNKDKYKESGSYQLTCSDCKEKCLGQTGRAFYKRFNEHLQSLKNCNTSAKFAHRFRENGHTFGSTEEIMDVLHYYKGRKSYEYCRKILCVCVCACKKKLSNDKLQCDRTT